ncbi:hypothetical protein ACFOOL_02340 [Devosia honganensis]|uniref:N-acylglucosamine 2-epimerase n=1 Tax=Devosia honganensis TaxID=1610527 RepID=A0ABV7WZ78_9HYPH
MSAAHPFIGEASRLYVAANVASLDWMLARPALGPGFLNTKQNSITLADYGPDDGLRGPAYTYGWIQGRGLEALATHAGLLASSHPELVDRIDAAGRRLYALLRDLWERDGHGYFCYDAGMQPVIAGPDGSTSPQAPAGETRTYSDIFILKGLIAAAARYDRQSLDGHLARLPALVHAIEGGRFQMNERRRLGPEALAAQEDDFGPRMILLGAAGMLQRIGRPEAAGFADRFLAHVLDRHLDRASGLLRNVPGADACNIGHGIELVGFALDYLPADADKVLVQQLERVLLASFTAGFSGPGIRLGVSVATGAPQSPYCPWWSLPETIRAAALCHERTGNPQILEVWRRAHEAFFDNFWRSEAALAYQTLTDEGPVDFVPATPDLDPGYHTGLSLLAAIQAAGRMGVARSTRSNTGA